MNKTIKSLIIAAAITTSLSTVAKADPVMVPGYNAPLSYNFYNAAYSPSMNWHTMSVASMTQDRSPENIANIQQNLASLGYNIGPSGITGHVNKSTTLAIRRFQADNHIKIDGVVGFTTADALNSDGFRFRSVAPAANYSSNIAVIQGELTELGFNVGQNGMYDVPTAQAIRVFQSQNGLSISGIADQSTVNAMNSEVTAKRSYNVNYVPSWNLPSGTIPITY